MPIYASIYDRASDAEAWRSADTVTAHVHRRCLVHRDSDAGTPIYDEMAGGAL